MKHFVTIIMLLATFFAKGQIVNIPDANFKNFLLNYSDINHPFPFIDGNHDGEIQESEALAVRSLIITDTDITDLTGLSAFRNLKNLYFHTNAQAVDLSGNTELDTLGARTPFLLSLDISPCSKLSRFYLGTSVPVSALHSLIIGTHDSLKSILIDDGNFDELDLRGCKNLSSFNYGSNGGNFCGIKKIYASGLTKLTQLNFEVYVADGILEYLDLEGCTGLVSIRGQGSNSLKNLSYLNLTGCTSLTDIVLYSVGFDYLDLSTCYNLKSIQFSSPRKINLNLKNGSALNNFNYAYYNILPGSNICADEFEVDEFNSFLNGELHLNVNINPYCTFFPGGISNTIKGVTKVDLNNNGCDSTDNIMGNVPIRITDTLGNSMTRYSTNTGNYAHYPKKGDFTLTPYFPYPYFFINPASTTVSFDTANNLVETRDFCIQPNGVHNDLEVIFLPLMPARPGFSAMYSLMYKNRGNTTLSGNVALNFDNSKINLSYASENATTQSTGQLTWNYASLQPFESKTINVTFNLLPPPTNNIGDTINYLAAITPSANDETPFDNSFILPQRVIASFDPNEKECLEGRQLDIANIGGYLHYMVRFQNEGTDTAFNIVVADTLSAKLDWNSFEFIKASHPVDVRLTNNKAEFIFENIHLPYKAINEPESHGWVAFKIKPKPSVVIGDSLNNSAAIYFDFNKPVITNTATTIVSSLSSPVPVKLEYFSVNQKSNSNILNWKASCNYGIASFIIERSNDWIHFTVIGNIKADALRCQLPFNFTDNNPETGKNYYRIKISDADGKSFYSKTLVVGNSKAGIEITAVANNIFYLKSNKQQTIQMKIIAEDGKEIWNEIKNVAAGKNNISLQIKNAAKGIYTLLLYASNGETATTKFVW